MNKGKNEQLKKLKRIRILDEVLLFFGRNKIGFKSPKDKAHYTIKFLREGIVDFHETIEGKNKRYPRAGKLHLEKFAEVRETLRRELPKLLKEIDIEDPKYEGVDVIVCPTKEEIGKTIEVRKKEIRIEEDDVFDMLSLVPMKDLQDYDFQVAFWGKEDEEHALFRIDGRYFMLKVDDLETLFDNLFEKLDIQGFSHKEERHN